MRKYQKSEFILLISDGVWGLFLIETFLKNRDPPSVFKCPKLKLRHFWVFLFGHCHIFSHFFLVTPPLNKLVFIKFFFSFNTRSSFNLFDPSGSNNAINDDHVNVESSPNIRIASLFQMASLSETSILFVHLHCKVLQATILWWPLKRDISAVSLGRP